MLSVGSNEADEGLQHLIAAQLHMVHNVALVVPSYLDGRCSILSPSHVGPS